MDGVINLPILHMTTPRHRGISEVTSKQKRCFLSILGKRFGKRPCRLLGEEYSFSMPSLKKVNKIKYVT